MAYQKKILYLDYYENGERLSGGGFVKLEVRQEKLRLDVTVRGLRPTDSFVRDVLLQSGEKQVKLGQLDIREGCGRFSYEERPEGERGEMSFSCLELGELKIPIGGAREIRCKLTGSGPRAVAPSERSGASTERPGGPSETLGVSSKSPAASPERIGTYSERCGASSERLGASSESLAALSGKPAAEEKDLAGGPRRQQLTAAETAVVFGKAQASPERGTGQPKESPAEEEQTARSVRRQPAEKNKRPVRLREDKWQQLSAIYPHIHPFQDEREYLSIRPADFVLFPAKYYQAVNNSFLLHGYYNYEHLILARLEQRGETQYYLGVPGSYYEREKQVALMFGFESFESASEPAKTGDFGYYMMRTQL